MINTYIYKARYPLQNELDSTQTTSFKVFVGWVSPHDSLNFKGYTHNSYGQTYGTNVAPFWDPGIPIESRPFDTKKWDYGFPESYEYHKYHKP